MMDTSSMTDEEVAEKYVETIRAISQAIATGTDNTLLCMVGIKMVAAKTVEEKREALTWLYGLVDQVEESVNAVLEKFAQLWAGEYDDPEDDT